MKYSKLFIYLIVCHIIAVCLFVIGFLPLKSKNVDFADWSHPPHEFLNAEWNPDNYYNPKWKRAVFIVIDALRADFILGENLELSMPYLYSLHQNNRACSFFSKAHTPTVTLPRIKAMVTGSVPGFSDVIFNLGSSKLEEDNIVNQLVLNGHKVVFYGDETWLRLFPNNQFVRSEGTTSFFVNDYTEVDYNVTRNLDFELNQTDWSVMILHYLGLDHIGHISGPKSPLVPEKLKEMDNVIKKIHSQFQQSDNAIIICGDHGMSDSGSHGGSSPAEIEIPLTFIMKGCLPNNKSSLQIDLVPTLSIMMGIPIPFNSLGSLLTGILPVFKPIEKLHAAFSTAHTVARQFKISTKKSAEESLHFQDYQRALKLYQDHLAGVQRENEDGISQLFIKATKGMSDHLIKSLVTFDFYLMTIAMTLSLQVFLILTTESSNLIQFVQLHTTHTVTIIAALLFIIFNVVMCISINNDSLMCVNGQNYISHTILLNGLVLTTLVTNCYLIRRNLLSISSIKSLGNIPECFLMLGSVAHAASLASSSFVEEEHQTYYYLVSSLAFLLMWNRKNDSNEWRNVCRLGGALILLRISRGWNQTGDKWIAEPDIKQWLNSHPICLTFASFFGVLGIFTWILSTQCLNSFQKTTTGVACTGILAYRAALNTFSLNYPASMGITEATLTYVFIGMILIATKDRTSTSITTWIVLTCLLKRPHNLLLTLLQLVQYSLLQPVFADQLRPFYQGLASYWIGMSWYFHQGNANSLARIDVAAGYVGLSDYDAVAVGFLLLCATYSGPVLSLLLSLKNGDKSLAHLYGFVWTRALVVTFFVIIVALLRHHLFIWSVFSPKLLYEAANSYVLCLALILSHLSFD